MRSGCGLGISILVIAERVRRGIGGGARGLLARVEFGAGIEDSQRARERANFLGFRYMSRGGRPFDDGEEGKFAARRGCVLFSRAVGERGPFLT